jgi:hypothetical protein
LLITDRFGGNVDADHGPSSLRLVGAAEALAKGEITFPEMPAALEDHGAAAQLDWSRPIDRFQPRCYCGLT